MGSIVMLKNQCSAVLMRDLHNVKGGGAHVECGVVQRGIRGEWESVVAVIVCCLLRIEKN